jgi:class 3 adenylate cyclase
MGLGIGIHRGILMEGIIGAAHVKYYDVIGDTVNTAKGIEEAARADEILISLAAASQLFTRFRILGRHALSIKGKSEPVTVFRVLSRRTEATKTLLIPNPGRS